ncbi:MAG TPA: hypothetical protein VF692_14635 [Pyrinomonadaceae bacterium]|jgi:hypothetical protein
MLLLIWLIFGLLLITIPLCLLKIYNAPAVKEFNPSKITIKLLLSFFVYFLMSLIIPLMMLFIIVGPDPRPNKTIPFVSKLMCLILVGIYGFAGWLLGSFVSGKFIKSWQDFSFYEEKAQSLFDAE